MNYPESCMENHMMEWICVDSLTGAWFCLVEEPLQNPFLILMELNLLSNCWKGTAHKKQAIATIMKWHGIRILVYNIKTTAGWINNG